MTRTDAAVAQIEAANPATSTWLSANAGSGKTRVLTDRVSLLLLNGVKPEKILCLTYTKAAASEMQNRLFQRLGEWTMMPDDHLRDSLTRLTLDQLPPSPDQLSEARRLFAKAIETPGGLKIQTIHSFCASILRRFPLEAGVSPSFTEMDNRQTKTLIDTVLESIALEKPEVLQRFAHFLSGDDTQPIIQEILKARASFAEPFDRARLSSELDVPPDLTAETILSQVFLGGEADLVSQLIPHLRAGGTTDNTLADRLGAIDFSTPSLALLEACEGLFLTGSGAKDPFSPKSTPPTKAVQATLGEAMEDLHDLRARVADARHLRIGLDALAKAEALHGLAAELIPRIDAEKARHGWLDFDDLILRARALLSNSQAAAWVLYRLDGGIDHILVDEAQDTSPDQWDVVRLLADEFTSGDSARPDIERTIFVVGDKKQSIYSFQGADPKGFTRMRDHFQTALSEVGKPFQDRELLYSFRSAQPIMALVDRVFSSDIGLGMGGRVEHHAFKSNLPGRIDLWPWESASDNPDPTKWNDPIDVVGADHHSVRLARRLAGFISQQLTSGQITTIDGGVATTRPIRPSDFLILVQKRSVLFHEIIRACKDHNLPMAGADRLRIGGELVVKDLVALLSWIATPEDDLSLAAVLRSPIGGFSEDQLYRLAHGRGDAFLRQRWEDRKDQHPELYEMLADLRNASDYLRPYEVLERALTRHGLREKLVARLGSEAEDGIDALLAQAMTFERANVPGLTAFLAWLSSEEVEIKRQMDNAGDQIRVMTVHGSKGLEAPIVILPETGNIRKNLRTEVLVNAGLAHWRANKDARPQVQRDLVTKLEEEQAQERARLLYVAMTRAESWLVICGGGEDPVAEKGAWYSEIETALQHMDTVTLPDGTVRVEHDVWPDDLSDRDEVPQPYQIDLPDWVRTRPEPHRAAPRSLSPSDLAGAKVLAGETSPEALSEEAAKQRGTAIHLALEYLPHIPQNRWELAAADLFPDHEQVEIVEMTDLVRNLLANPETAAVFAPDSLAEVAICARLDALGDQKISGFIDRLLVQDDQVLAVDFKSNRIVPGIPSEVPDGILRQMGAYAAALMQIYPNHRIKTAILWTQTAELMVLPHEIVRNALLTTHTS